MHMDGWTDGQVDRQTRRSLVTFCNFANAPKSMKHNMKIIAGVRNYNVVSVTLHSLTLTIELNFEC
jgi:hypothetical protein